MTSIRLPESVGLLTKTSSTVVSLAASRINIGGQQYVTVNPLTLSVGTIGAGGVDATLTGNSLYYVYAVVSAGAMTLVGSKVSTLPAGFTSARLVGHFNTDGALNINRALFSGQLVNEAASLATSDLRNLIINGNIDFWQRGTSFTISNAGATTADRFGSSTGTANYNIVTTRSTDVPTFTQSGFASVYSILQTNGTGSATGASDNNSIAAYKMEGLDYQAIHSKKVRIQFWIKSSVAGTYTLSLRNAAANRSYVAPITVIAANTWEKKSFDVQMDNSGTWAFDNGIGLRLEIYHTAGTTLSTSTTNTWVAGNFIGITGQTQLGVTTGATFQLAQVALYQVDANGADLPFYRHGKDLQQELAACQRYCEVFNAGTSIGVGLATSSTAAAGHITWQTAKRTGPSASVNTPSQFRYNNGSNNYPATGVSFVVLTPYGGQISLTGLISAGANVPGLFDIIGSGVMTIDAEL